MKVQNPIRLAPSCPRFLIRGKHAQCIDFQARWPEVLEAMRLPAVFEAYNASMSFLCHRLGVEWDGIQGPWYYSATPHAKPPQPMTLDWYRCFGASHSFANWCGEIGKALYPFLTWGVASAMNLEHSAAVGLKGDKIVKVADVFWSPAKRPSKSSNATERCQGARRILDVLCHGKFMYGFPVSGYTDQLRILSSGIAGQADGHTLPTERLLRAA